MGVQIPPSAPRGGVAKWLRRGSAKPLYSGSNPLAASNQTEKRLTGGHQFPSRCVSASPRAPSPPETEGRFAGHPQTPNIRLRRTAPLAWLGTLESQFWDPIQLPAGTTLRLFATETCLGAAVYSEQRRFACAGGDVPIAVALPYDGQVLR